MSGVFTRSYLQTVRNPFNCDGGLSSQLQRQLHFERMTLSPSPQLLLADTLGAACFPDQAFGLCLRGFPQFFSIMPFSFPLAKHCLRPRVYMRSTDFDGLVSIREIRIPKN